MNLMSSVRKDQSSRVSNETSKWPDAALEVLLKEHPELDGTESSVEMDHVNDHDMSGQGTIIVRREDVAVEIPFFVRDGFIQPIDVFYVQGQAMPLSRRRLSEFLLDRGSPGRVSTEADPRRPYDQSSRADGQFSSGKTASALLRHMLASSSEETKRACVEAAREDHLLTLMQAGRTDLLSCLADAEPMGKTADHPVRAITWRRNAPGTYQVHEYSAHGTCVGEGLVKGASALEYASHMGWPEALDWADRDGFVALPTERVEPPTIVDEAMFKDAAADDEVPYNGMGTVHTKTGSHLGVLARVVTPDGEDTPKQLFIGEDMYVHGTKLAFAPASGAPSWPRVLATQDVEQASHSRHRHPKLAAWVWRDEQGYAATDPFYVRQLYRGVGPLKVASADMSGRRTDWTYSKTLKRMTVMNEKVSSYGQGYSTVLMPEDARLVALGESMSAVDPMVKEASFLDRPSEGMVQVVFQGGRYTVQSDQASDEDKVASLSNMTHPQTRCLWALCGLDKEAQDELMEYLAHHDEAKIAGLSLLPALSSEPSSPARPAPERYDPVKLSAAYDLVCSSREALWDLIKVAVEELEGDEEQNMTDTGLSTMLSEREEMDQLADGVPQIEKALSVLSQMLMRCRQEENAMRPEVISQAMRALDQIVQALRSADMPEEEATQL